MSPDFSNGTVEVERRGRREKKAHLVRQAGVAPRDWVA